jgi:hypothetical protein
MLLTENEQSWKYVCPRVVNIITNNYMNILDSRREDKRFWTECWQALLLFSLPLSPC